MVYKQQFFERIIIDFIATRYTMPTFASDIDVTIISNNGIMSVYTLIINTLIEI